MATQVQKALLCSCKDNMDKDVEKDPTLKGDQESRDEKANAPASSRRRFTRNALVGSSVVLPLGNRPAWGQIDPLDGCLSVNHFASFDPVHVSLGPNEPENDQKYQDFLNIVNNTGVDPDSPEGYVCPRPPAQGLDVQTFNTEFFPTDDKSRRQINVMKEKKEK